MSIRDRNRKPARRHDVISPKKRILVVCEGKKSEPNYINGFKAWTRNARVQVDVSNVHGCPLTLVQEACRKKKESVALARRERDLHLVYNIVACVFDIDTHPYIAQARALAKQNSILLAVSDPCFELWLLLHFRDDPGARMPDELLTEMRRHVPGFNKAVSFRQFQDGYHEAVRRAVRMEERSSGTNPSTTVFRLTESIRTE